MLSNEITDPLGNGAANVHASIIATPAFCRELNRIRENDFSRNPKLWPVFQDRGFHKVVAARAHHAPTAELLANYPDSTELLTGLQSECHVPEHGLEPGTLPDRLLFAAALSKAWENPASVENVITMPSDPAIYGSMLGLLANPNLVYREYSEMADELEKAVVRQIATLVGYDANQATGVFTQGGTFCNMYGYL